LEAQQAKEKQMLASMPLGNRLLESLPPADLDLLSRHLKRVSLDYQAVLHEQGAPAERIYFPLSGAIALLRVVQDGAAIMVAIVGREGAVGFGPDLSPLHAGVRTVVQAPGIAQSIAAPLFGSLVQQSPEIMRLLYRSVGMLSAQICQTAACNALHSVEQRLASFLLQVPHRIADNRILGTQDTLSQMLGVTRTTITLVAGKFQQLGLVRYRRGRIELLDRGALEKVACECFATSSFEMEKTVPGEGISEPVRSRPERKPVREAVTSAQGRSVKPLSRTTSLPSYRKEERAACPLGDPGSRQLGF
jgi:CRP-like cAMP-binding protein